MSSKERNYRGEARRRVEPAQERDYRDRIGGGQNRTQQHPARPAESEAQMGQATDQDHCHPDPRGGQQRDRYESPPELSQVDREGGLEHQARHEREKDEVAADAGELTAGQQADCDARRRQHHGIRQQASAPRHKAKHGRECADQDEQEQEALFGGQSSSVMPSRAAFTSVPMRWVRSAASSQGCARHTVMP